MRKCSTGRIVINCDCWPKTPSIPRQFVLTSSDVEFLAKKKIPWNSCGLTAYFENIRNHFINNGLISRIHGNVKRMPQWKTKIVINKNVAEAAKNFLENYAKIHGLPSPGRNVSRIIT